MRNGGGGQMRERPISKVVYLPKRSIPGEKSFELGDDTFESVLSCYRMSSQGKLTGCVFALGFMVTPVSIELDIFFIPCSVNNQRNYRGGQ